MKHLLHKIKHLGAPLALITLLLLPGLGWGQTAVVTARPTHIDLSSTTSESAVLMTLSGYTSNDARYRLYNGSNQYNPWDEASDAYITSTSYASGPQVPGTPTTSTTFWIVFQRGNNNATAATYRDRLGTAYSANNQTISLPTATSITSPFSLNGTFTGSGGYDKSVKHVVLGFNGTTIVTAASTTLSTGAFTLVCPVGTTIDKIEVRAIDNTSIASITGSWAGTSDVGNIPTGSTPTITVFPTALTGFSYVEGSGPSTAQSFTISGSDLTTDISIAASTNYEISETEGSGYTTPITLTQTGGTVEETTIYVRLKAGLTAGDYNDEVITASSTDAENKTVTCSGSVSEPPSITFYFRGPSWMNNNPHDPEIWGPFNEWESAATMTFGDVPGWWSVTVEVADASASIEYQSRFSQDGSTKYQKAFENFSANPTFTTTTGEIWIDASQNNSFYWQGNDFYLLQDKITETQPFAEPDNHVTEFSATANSSTAITVTWNDSDATGYLIKGSDVSYAAITAPVDGVEEANATLVRNVSYDNGNWQFTGLTAGTTYYFKIYPYNGTGASVNYKTDGTVPEADATTQEVPSIKWDGGALTTSWSDADNWSGNVVPTAADVVVLDNSLVSGSYSVVLPSGSVKTTILRLTIMPDLPNTITLTLPVENTYGASNDAGFVVGDNTAATDDIIINEGGVLINASGASSGNGIQVNSLSNGTLRINNGGKFIHKTTRSTGGTALAILLSTAAGTETGIYEYDVPGTSSFAIAASGRTYGSLILSRSGGSASYASSGSSPLTVKGDFILNSGVTYTTTMSGALNLGGDLTNNGTALTIASTQAINFNGTATQLISGTNDITFSGAVNITEGSYVSIEEGMSVTVSGSLTNNGSLTLQSNSTTTGSLIHSTAGVPATVERYISGHNNVADAGWHLLGSPVAAFDIDGSSFDPGASDDFYAWQESNSTWMNHKQGTPSQIVPGAGYLVSYETSGTKTFTGALNAADQTVTVTREGAGDYAGFNLIGNPFASAITWGSGWSLGSVGGVAYVWDEATKDYIDIEAGDPIPSANGVMVYLGGEETSQSLTIPAAARIHSSQGWYKSAGGRIVLVANDPDRGAAKRSVIRFNESATEGFDLAWDGYYLRGFAPGFYSVSNGMNYSVNTLPSMNNTLVIPMGFEKTVSSGFSIELQESIPGAVVYLTDKKTGTVTNLTDNGAYHFTAAEGDDANRFTLHFGTLGMDDPSTAAPVHIYAYGGVVYLNGLDVKASVTITDLTGRVVMAERVNGNGLAMLNAGSLPKGVYVVTAVAGSRVVSAKVIL